MKNKFNRALDKLAKSAEDMSNYDGEDSYDESSGNFSSANSRSIVRRDAKPPLVVVRSHQNPGHKLDKAQFDINIIRQTQTIAFPLQIALFGTTHLRSGYSQFVIPPIGVTFSVVGGLNSPVAGTNDRIRFIFTDGVNTDNVDVLCNQVPYPVFLEAMGQDMFRISNIRYRLTNSLNTIQFSQPHKFQGKSLFGKGSDDDLNIGAYLKPEQFQPGVIDIPIAADIDKETMFLPTITNLAVAVPFSFTLSVFVEKFNKHDRMNLR